MGLKLRKNAINCKNIESQTNMTEYLTALHNNIPSLNKLFYDWNPEATY